MEPIRNVEKPSSSILPKYATGDSKEVMTAASRPEKDLLTEHAIDDYITVDKILPLLLSDHDSVIATLNERLTRTKQICISFMIGHALVDRLSRCLVVSRIHQRGFE